MKNNKVILAIVAGLVIASSVIAWLMLGGDKPTNVNLGKGVSAQINASLKNSVIKREKDGKPLWEFTVAEVINVHEKNIAILKGIKGKLYRSDGSSFEMSADQGEVAIKKDDFSLEGHVQAKLTSGGEFSADKVTWQQKDELITAQGHVKLVKDDYIAVADEASTTSAFQSVKLKGNAKVTKDGE